ncbi:MAG: TolC family protein [Verrucomicrobiales bacterium]|nr:TolC family protein [Verrucomicrobiales bacterium]
MASASLLNGRAAEDAKPVAATNVVVITTGYINRLVAEARTNNPSLKAADSRVRSATLNAGAVRTWEDPTALFGGSVYSPQGFSASEDGDLAYGVEQKLPLWGRPKLTRRVAEAETSMREAEVNYRAQQLRSDITKALLRVALAERVVEIGGQDLAWVEATAKATDNKYRAGRAVIADTLQIQNEVAKRNDILRTDRLRLAHERFTLNRLLNRGVSSQWPSLQLPPVAPAIPLSAKILSLALQNEPKLKVLEQEIKQAAASAELTRQTRLPDVSVGIEGRQYSGDGEFRSGMFTLRFSLPWANRDKYRKDYQRDKERQKSAEQEREDQVLMVRDELHHLAVGIEAARREALLQSAEITARSARALTSRLSEWEAGRGAFRDVLDARRMLLESELLSARATAEEHELLAEMLLWTGLENLEALTPLAAEPALLPDHGEHDEKP